MVRAGRLEAIAAEVELVFSQTNKRRQIHPARARERSP